MSEKHIRLEITPELHLNIWVRDEDRIASSSAGVFLGTRMVMHVIFENQRGCINAIHALDSQFFSLRLGTVCFDLTLAEATKAAEFLSIPMPAAGEFAP